MIKEDYCDFETAKLLKEKGFDVVTNTSYVIDNYQRPFVKVGDFLYNRPTELHLIAAPTSALAMRWLREVHNINIEVFYFGDGDPARWAFEIIRLPIGVTVFGEYNKKSYEDACEAAIKYVLENLI